ncbi:DUF6130 family protein [Amycolatopsis sp. WAC 04197]|uniref:DUF6130 family protein n=1 Tax=Amycolatopsis sp. WAC 04197 TaxID=2203199 RepID=UPI001F299DC2|nr:DUF6130 family protein [Amycolatopsis sp. WAC 04197]
MPALGKLALAAAVLLTAACGAPPPPPAPPGAAAGWSPAPVVPLPSQPPPSLVVDAPLPEQLAMGLVVLRYRAENLRIVPVYGPAALDVSPRIGHIHVTVDDAAWHWADGSGEPLIIQSLPAGPHKVWIGLADPTHKILDEKTVNFVVPVHSGHH